MTKILVVGGELIDLYADYEYARGDSSAKSRDRRRELRTTAKVVKTTNDIYKGVTNETSNRYETIGGYVGFGVGVAYGYATLPVIAADGPLPFMDLAWAYSTARITKRSVDTGRRIGKLFD